MQDDVKSEILLAVISIVLAALTWWWWLWGKWSPGEALRDEIVRQYGTSKATWFLIAVTVILSVICVFAEL